MAEIYCIKNQRGLEQNKIKDSESTNQKQNNRPKSNISKAQLIKAHNTSYYKAKHLNPHIESDE